MNTRLFKSIIAYDYEAIIKAIAKLGTEDISGMSVIYKEDVEDVLKICDTHELAEILNVLKR